MYTANLLQFIIPDNVEYRMQSELPQKLGRAKLGYGKPAYIQHFPQCVSARRVLVCLLRFRCRI